MTEVCCQNSYYFFLNVIKTSVLLLFKIDLILLTFWTKLSSKLIRCSVLKGASEHMLLSFAIATSF